MHEFRSVTNIMQLSINNEENISKMFKQFVEDCKNIKLAKIAAKLLTKFEQQFSLL